jgi:hypothetical protein
MAVEVHFIGRLGNNLFQYALGRILAEELGYKLVCRDSFVPNPRLANGLSGQLATLPALASHFDDVPLHIDGEDITQPHERYVLKERLWSGQGIPFQAMLADRAPRRIVLKGYFQRIEYYLSYKAKIRSWFKPLIPQGVLTPHPDDVVLNIRRGLDYFKHGWVLPKQYYVEALRAASPRRLFVCGVGIDAEIVELLEPYSPTYYSASPFEEFCFISRFNRIVLSNSTFAWWAAWLSDASEIFFPSGQSPWGEEFPEVNLKVPEARYRYVPAYGLEPWRPFARRDLVSVKQGPGRDQNLAITAGTASVSVPGSFKPVVEWILNTTGRFGPQDLIPHLNGVTLNEAISQLLPQLISAGILTTSKEWELYTSELSKA